MPADTSIYIIFIMDGEGTYEGMKVKKGDVAVLGLNKHPIIGGAENMSLFILDIDFILFYRITGLFPEACCNVIKMNEGSVLVELANILQDFPKNLWRKVSENFIEAFLSKDISLRYTKMERIYYASKRIKSNVNRDFSEMSRDMGVSSRQLERDFKLVLGITPKDYQRITRFQLALKLMKDKDLSQAAIIAGYCDQSHMTKEFKRMSLWTPGQSSIHVEDLLSNMDYRNYS